jgi:hypothetical protein
MNFTTDYGMKNIEIAKEFVDLHYSVVGKKGIKENESSIILVR